jgi:hypothetical protein
MAKSKKKTSHSSDASGGSAQPYQLTVDLQVLRHLGIGLYSNVPAVVSEMVANAYDADAREVMVTIDAERIDIQDDGLGMDASDANNKFLTVGYDKRGSGEATTPKLKRKPMGRKGIGKLSAFAIASDVQIQSIKRDPKTGKEIGRAAFVMNVADIESRARSGQPYFPTALSTASIKLTKGTRIVLSLKKKRSVNPDYIRVNLARRFSVIGQGFQVLVNKRAVTPAERQYRNKLQFVWGLGVGDSFDLAKAGKKVRKSGVLPNSVVLPGGTQETVSGWIGTVHLPKELKEGVIDNNGIVVMARGKLVHENLLPFARTAKIFAEYVVGEINADWLDDEGLGEDMATSGRQSLKEDDTRFIALQSYAKDQLEYIAEKWSAWRREVGVKEAVERNPALQDWLDEMTDDNRKQAEKLISTIDGMPVADEDDKKVLFKHGIMAFETLALKGNLERLGTLPEHDHKALSAIFESLGDLEAAHYSQIVKSRLGVLNTFEKGVDEAEHEKVLQKHIYKNPWLIDASWERATQDIRMEKRFLTKLNNAKLGRSRDKQLARYDIKFMSISGKVLIVELKRSDRLLTIREILDQGTKYSDLAEGLLIEQNPDEPAYYEIIFLLGKLPTDYVKAKSRYEGSLKPQHIRIMTYEQLITHARQSYGDYLERQEKVERIQKIVDKV